MKSSKAEVEDSKRNLIEVLGRPSRAKPLKVYAIVRHVAPSGMSRLIDLLIFKGGQPLYIGFHAGRVLGWTYDRDRGGLKVGGAGMDMVFHTVSSLSYALYGNEYALQRVTL